MIKLEHLINQLHEQIIFSIFNHHPKHTTLKINNFEKLENITIPSSPPVTANF